MASGYLVTTVKHLLLYGWRAVNWGLSWIEHLTSHGGMIPLRWPPIFIIGPPRCGSTLIYQAMTNYFDVAYVSNLHCLVYGAPSLVERVFRPRSRRTRSGYSSSYGKTRGWTGPSECAPFWYRFFRRRPQYVPLHEARHSDFLRLRAAIRAFGKAAARPILFKNMLCALRLQPVARALPEALFVVVKRDEIDNAHSLLEARMALFGSYECWWSMEPPEIDTLKNLPCHQQVLEQIRHIHRLIDRERPVVGRHRFIDVQYEAFCQDTKSELHRLEAFFFGHGVPIAREGEVPDTFERRPGTRVDPVLYEKMVAYARAQH